MSENKKLDELMKFVQVTKGLKEVFKQKGFVGNKFMASFGKIIAENLPDLINDINNVEFFTDGMSEVKQQLLLELKELHETLIDELRKTAIGREYIYERLSEGDVLIISRNEDGSYEVARNDNGKIIIEKVSTCLKEKD